MKNALKFIVDNKWMKKVDFLINLKMNFRKIQIKIFDDKSKIYKEKNYDQKIKLKTKALNYRNNQWKMVVQDN